MVGHNRSVKAKALRTILPRCFDQRLNLRHERRLVPLRNHELFSWNPTTLPNSQLVVICHPQCLPSEEFYLRSRAFVILGFLICPNSRQVTIGMLFAFRTAQGSSMALAMDAVAHYRGTSIWCGETERTLDAYPREQDDEVGITWSPRGRVTKDGANQGDQYPDPTRRSKWDGCGSGVTVRPYCRCASGQ
jgi:hypothetical protein